MVEGTLSRPVALFSVLSLVVAVTLAVWWAAARPAAPLQVFATGFDEPVVMLEVDGRLLVGERGGLVKIVGQEEPLLDLRDSVETGYWEQGLLGIAAVDDRLFVHYSRTGDGATVIEAYPIGGAEPQPILTARQPAPRHNGGQLKFGPDGYLYVGLGDGGDVGLSFARGQSTDDLLGSILRIDVSGIGGYAIPGDNPYVESPGRRPELWSIGLRNPWQFSFDRETGDLFIADVGYASAEEVNRQPAGEGGMNFGWAMYEGTTCHAFEGETCDPLGVTMPQVEYSHEDGNCAVIGGHVYRGQSHPEHHGQYFFADYCSGRIWTIDSRDPDPTPALFLETDAKISAFAEDASGELYVLSHEEGTIYRLLPVD